MQIQKYKIYLCCLYFIYYFVYYLPFIFPAVKPFFILFYYLKPRPLALSCDLLPQQQSHDRHFGLSTSWPTVIFLRESVADPYRLRPTRCIRFPGVDGREWGGEKTSEEHNRRPLRDVNRVRSLLEHHRHDNRKRGQPVGYEEHSALPFVLIKPKQTPHFTRC